MKLIKYKAVSVLILVLTFSMMSMSFSATSAELSYVEAINKAGRQRMLTQRITKLYCQIGLDVAADKSGRQLQEAIDLFSSQLLALKQFSIHRDINAALADIESLWTPFRDLALSDPLQENTKQLVEMDKNLLMANEDLVAILVNRSGNAVTRLINISGRQRMLSQRLAKLYLLKSWGQGTPAIDLEIDRARNEFAGALDALIQAPENTFLIKEKHEKAKLQWAWFSSSLNFSQNEYFPRIVVDTSERLLGIMEKITEMYQELAINNSLIIND